MKIHPHDQTVLDRVAEAGAHILSRAVAWSGINSGSRNDAGLARMLDVLEAEARTLPAEIARIPTSPSSIVGDAAG